MKTPLHKPAPHESAVAHVTGRAVYVDDIPDPPGCLVALAVPSAVARGRITALDVSAARALPGVHAVLTRDDIPGAHLIGPIVHDEPLLAESEVHFQGQSVAVIIADSYEIARRAVGSVVLEIEELAPILSIEDAIAHGAFLTTPHVIARGDVRQALSGAAEVVEARMECGGQDHFYLETQAALVVPVEGGLKVYSSTQHPSEVQREVAAVLGLSVGQVVCEVPRMGGGFGGKESQASPWACLAALGSQVTGRPVRMWLDRDQDMRQTGKRHPFTANYRAGFDPDGRITALEVEIWSNGGWSADLSGPVLDRALFHLDNAYYIPALHFTGLACRTNLPSNTAFRGFGGPQGILVIEDALNRYAERHGLDGMELRRRNYYLEGQATPYGQPVIANRLERIHAELAESCEWDRRLAEVETFNARSRFIKRGLGFMPVKFGISFTASLLNQAGALVLVYTDGSVQLNHGGTEMGQGLHTKMLTVCAHQLGIPTSAVRQMNTATDKVPNTSATAASSGSDLNGAAVRDACRQIRERMAAVAARVWEVEASSVCFEDGQVSSGEHRMTFGALANRCWAEQVSLAASGYYATPGIAYDRDTGQGTPFFYYAFGAAVSEVEVNRLTGEYRVTRADVLHDVGDSLVPTIDLGQVEGAYVQGMGWLTCEEVLYDSSGRLLTHGPSTYKIPAVGDVPADFRVALLDRAPQQNVIGGSKAVGEPPFMLAIGVVAALRHAIAAWAPGEVELALPATPEAVLRAITHQRRLRDDAAAK